MHNVLDREISLKSILKFTLPSMSMMIFLSVYIMVDGIFIANYVGAVALSGTNIIFPIVNIVLALAIMLATGGSAIVSRQMGEGKALLAKQTFSSIIYFAIIFSILIAISFYVFLEDIIYFLGSNEETYKYSWDYGLMMCIGTPFLALQVLFQYFLIARGRPNYAMYVIFIAGFLNMILDYVFIVIFNLGTLGAGLATILGYAWVSVFGLLYFSKNKASSLYFTKPNWDYKVIIETIINGSSEMVNQVATALIIFLFNITMMKYVGVNGVAAITIILYLHYLLTSIFFGYASGISPLFAFNFGKKDFKRIKILFKYSIFISIFISICIFSICWIFDGYLVGFFIEEKEVFQMAFDGLTIVSFAFLFIGFNVLASALFTAFSNGKVSAFLAFSRTFIMLAPMIVFLPKLFGEFGIWLSLPLSEFLCFCLTAMVIYIYKNNYKYFS